MSHINLHGQERRNENFESIETNLRCLSNNRQSDWNWQSGRH